MAHYGWSMWYSKLIQRLAASYQLAAILQPRLWPDEDQFGLAHSTTSYHHIVCSAVNVGTLLDIWPIVAGYDGR